MADEQEQAILPVEQDTVPFYDRQIIAARLPDGRIAASLRNMCDALQLERQGQVRRIRDDDTLADQLVPVRVETDGGGADRGDADRLGDSHLAHWHPTLTRRAREA